MPITDLTYPAPQPLRLTAAATISNSRSSSVTERRLSLPTSRQASKDASTKAVDSHPRGLGIQQLPITRSPKDLQLSSPSSSDLSDDEKFPKPTVSRRLNPSSVRHRPPPSRKHQSSASDEGADGEDDDDSSPFLPFAASTGTSAHQLAQDPGATLRGGFGSPPRPSRSPAARKVTMERVLPADVRDGIAKQQMTSSASSNSSEPGGPSSLAARPPPLLGLRRTGTRASVPLSPQRAAELAAAGLSPLRRLGNGREGSDGSPSMGSSFSDLDDASVTQSALEEALLSNMQHGRNGSVASRMSTISQALRSRVFDQGGR